MRCPDRRNDFSSACPVSRIERGKVPGQVPVTHARMSIGRLCSASTKPLPSLLRWSLLVALAGCTAVAVPMASADGEYRGSATRFQVLRRTCQRPGLLNIPVRAGIMFYRWENQYMQVQVLSSGAVTGSLPGVRLTGTYDGTIIQGDVTDGQCGLHFTLKRVGA